MLHSIYGSGLLDFDELLGQCTANLSEPNWGSKTSYNFIHHILYFRCLASYTVSHYNFTIFPDWHGGSA